MLTDVYNQKGEKTGQAQLPKEIFGVKFRADLVHQVFSSMVSNKRRPIAHAKDRGEVRGGGKKPWRQKGTGRARHGSIRSPLWRGGGVTFGPRNERNFKKRIPKKMKRSALFSVLSVKLKDNEIIVLDNLSLKEPKTKLMDEILDNLEKAGLKQKNCLIILPKKDKNIGLAARNIAKIKTAQINNFNILDILSFKYLLFTKETIGAMKEKLIKD